MAWKMCARLVIRNIFANCEPEKCRELMWARQEIVEGGIRKT